MKNFVIVVIAVLLISGMIAVEKGYAGGSAYVSKIILNGDSGIKYDLNLNETAGSVKFFANAEARSDLDGKIALKFDKLEGGMTYAFNKAIATTVKYSEDYRNNSDIERLYLDTKFIYPNGFSIRPSVERDIITNNNVAMLGAGYEW